MALSPIDFTWTTVLAILAAALAHFALGAFWYSKAGFGRLWTELIGKPMDELGDPVKGITINALATILVSVGLAVIIHAAWDVTTHNWVDGLGVGALAGVCFVMPTLLNSVAFEGRPPALFFLNAAYQVIGYCIMGAILGAWW